MNIQTTNHPAAALLNRDNDSADTHTLTKADLANMIYTQVGLNKREAKEIIDDFFEAISSLLEQGQEVKLSGFGSFLLREKKQRPGRNPKTGEAVPVSARRVVVFHASQKLKEQVNIKTSEDAQPTMQDQNATSINLSNNVD